MPSRKQNNCRHDRFKVVMEEPLAKICYCLDCKLLYREPLLTVKKKDRSIAFFDTLPRVKTDQ